MKIKIAITILALIPILSLAKAPDCSKSWPMNMAEGWMKSSGIITEISALDESKTQVKQLASEKIGKSDGENIYTQVYRFIFHGKDGKTYHVITQSDASKTECSISDINIYLIAKSDITHKE